MNLAQMKPQPRLIWFGSLSYALYWNVGPLGIERSPTSDELVAAALEIIEHVVAESAGQTCCVSVPGYFGEVE